ncbi:hypothetical protein ACFL1H_04825 [Nanoarchaeota archaeon]
MEFINDLKTIIDNNTGLIILGTALGISFGIPIIGFFKQKRDIEKFMPKEINKIKQRQSFNEIYSIASKYSISENEVMDMIFRYRQGLGGNIKKRDKSLVERVKVKGAYNAIFPVTTKYDVPEHYLLYLLVEKEKNNDPIHALTKHYATG